MTSPRFETFLAKLYTDGVFRTRFLENRREIGREFGLSEAESDELESIDLTGLELAADSFSRKRLWKEKHPPPVWWRRVFGRILLLLGIPRA